MFYYIQCVPQKRKPINRVNFSENCNDLSEKAYIFTKFSLSSFFWHQLQDVLAMHEQALTISNGDVKNDLPEWEFKGLTGSATFQKQRDVLKDMPWYFFCLFCHVSSAFSLFWHGLASLNLVILLNTIILRKSFLTCMRLNCFLSFMHWDIIMCLVSNERRENALDNEAYSLFQSCMAMKISHWENGFPFYWDALYSSISLWGRGS